MHTISLRKIFLLILAVVPGILAFNVKAGTIRYDYYFDNFTLSSRGIYQNLVFGKTIQTAACGQPELPWASVSLLIPAGETASSIEFFGEGLVEIPGSVLLYPHQPSEPLSKTTEHQFITDKKAYASAENYPRTSCGKLITQYMNGYTLALSSFTPASYIASTRKLWYYSKVTIVINTKPSETKENLLLSSSKSAIERVKRFAQNPEMLSQYDLPLPADTTDYQMLIISPEIFASHFQGLIDFYQTRGLKVKVKSLNVVYANSAGIDNAEKIRNYIIQEYQNNAIEHVLLAGDAELMPYRGLYCEVMSSSLYTDNDIPSDIYFSALDGNWNADSDSKWGEPGEEDLLPEISVGRFCASDINELNVMLNKTLMYQQSPVIADLNKPLLVGENLYNNPLTWGADYLDLLIGTHSDNGYTTSGLDSTQVYDTLYDRGAPAAWTYTQLLTKINQGHSFLYHVGHANTTYLMRMYNSTITAANFSQVNGTTHGFMPVYSHGCYCGQFDASDCIAEKMLCIPNFCNVFIGNSRYGWFNEGTTEGPSQHINREFVDALYNDGERAVGMAHTLSKIATAPWVTAPGQWEEGALRWCMFTCNVLGDPAMQIWTNPPATISGTVSYSNATSDPLDSVTVYLHKNGILAGQYTTNASGVFTFPNVAPGVYTLETQCSKAWGGAGSSDALMVMRHFVQMAYLQGIFLAAADIDGSQYINSIDALAILKRFVGITSSFPVSDWTFEQKTVTIGLTGQNTIYIKGLCTGDVNGSWLPNGN